jgi:hypothetical protein
MDVTVGRLGNGDGRYVSYELAGKVGRLNGARGRVYQVLISIEGINRMDVCIEITAIAGYGLNSVGLGGPFVKLYP